MAKKKESEEIKEFLKNLIKNQKFLWGVTILIFLVILYSSVSIRLSNVPILKDQTTGKYTSNDLDSLYFYRIAETRLKLGYLPELDELRSPGYNIEWIPELIDDYLIWNYKILRIFNPEITFDYAATISAPIFFAIGLILFFILSYLLTKSKIASLIGSAFLAFAPGFLFRSIAGFYDHDHIGVFAIFALMIGLYFSLKNYEKNWKNSLLYGVLCGFLTALVLVSWGGAITFVLVFFPLTMLLHYLFNSEKKENFFLFYFIWIVFSVIFTPILGSKAEYMYSRFLDSQGVLVLFVFVFSIIDFLFLKYKEKIKFLKIKENYFHFYSLGVSAILGIIGLVAIGKHPIQMFRRAWATLIYPFFGDFGGRLGTTVAENAQPHLVDLINQNGQILFLFFLIGLIFVCANLSLNSKSIKTKIAFSGSSMLLLFGILFSRISDSSLLNGENFISQALYAISGVVFLTFLFYISSKERFKISIDEVILFALAVTVAMNARAAIRSFFLITPFICLIAADGISEFIKRIKKKEDKEIKYIYFSVVLITIILSYVYIFGVPFVQGNLSFGIYEISKIQASRIGPSANIQWQNAMKWVRENTNEKDIFTHWWDYGYFIQTLANRPTVTDGGHSGGDHTDHYNGRYLLTTPNPKTALSYMKTWNVSYLLIDPTEMGKYGAFSKIGSNDSWDRVSAGIFGGPLDERQTQETSKGEIRVYQLGGCVDGDISFETDNGSKVFIPGITVTKTQQMVCNAYVAGVIVEIENLGNFSSIKQPTAVFFYNNKQHRIPIKHIYRDGEIFSFEKGIDSLIYFIPLIDEKQGKIVDSGAIIYLSPRTFNSLMGRLYILNDPYNEYPTIKKAHFEDDPVVAYFKQFYPGLNEFIWYQGIRAPLKIWKVEYPEDTPVYKEFLDPDYFIKNGFGGMDKFFE
ncbi:MAG: STT3 domain-containing protein [Candidatus Pacearchaeota archaeon]